MSINAYRAALRSNVRGLWTGVLDEGQFFDGMRGAINRRLTQSAELGAESCNIKFNEFTPAEQLELGKAIQTELTFLQGLATDIQDNKRGVGKLTPFLNRVSELWLNRYREFNSKFKALVCKDLKMEWVLNPIKENCPSCVRLNGKVKRGSFWTNSGILPNVPNAGYLVCGGFNCGCELVPTSKPISKGPLPGLP